MLSGDHRGLSHEVIGWYVLIIISLAVGISVVVTLFSNPLNSQDIDEQLSKNIDPYGKDICDQYEVGQKIDELDFKRLLFSHYRHTCNDSSNYVKLDFTLSQEKFEGILIELGITTKGLPFYLERDGCEDLLTFTGIIVDPSNTKGIIFQKNDRITIGERKNGARLCFYSQECGDDICDSDERANCQEDCGTPP